MAGQTPDIVDDDLMIGIFWLSPDGADKEQLR